MSNPPDEMPEHTRVFVASLSKDDIDRLSWLLGVVEMVEGWCKVNRMIGKFLIVSVIGLLVFVWQGIDAITKIGEAIARAFGKN